MKRSDITAIFPEATSEQIDQLLNLNGGDINKAKGELDTIKSQFNAMQSEFNALKTKSNDANEDELNALRSELDGLKSANALRDIREKVSKEKGVPMNLLTGSTEEDCTAQADAIMEFVGSSKPSYPGLKDGGEVRTPSTTATRDKFAEWFNNTMT